MEISKIILICIYSAIGLYLLFKFIFRRNHYLNEYEKLYNEILTSKKYRVKGQFDKEE